MTTARPTPVSVPLLAGKPAPRPAAVNPSLQDRFRKFASWTSVAAGSPWTFVGASVFLLLWAMSYPLFLRFQDPFNTWQLVINTVTTIVTFLMVFLIQNTQNRDAKAIHLKLDELIRANKGARNRLVELENCTDEELEELRREFERIHRRATGKTLDTSDKQIARVEVEQQKRATDA
jgi:low affinity Fe/Cu permease